MRIAVPEHPVEGLLSEAMLLSDCPDAPLTIFAELRLSPEGTRALRDEASRKRATCMLLAQEPKLLELFELKTGGIRRLREEIPDLDAYVEQVWSWQDAPRDAFRSRWIPIDSPPLFRLRFSETDGLQFTGHHALLDGHSGIELLRRFIGLVAGAGVSADEEFASGPRRKRRLRDLGASVPNFSRLFVRPVLFSPKESLLGIPRISCMQTVPGDWVRERLERVRLHAPEIQLPALELAAFHLCLGELADQRPGRIWGGHDLISTVVPIDLRRQLGVGMAMGNFSASITLRSRARDRRAPLAFALELHQRLGHAVRAGLAERSVSELKFLRAAGVFSSSRKVRAETGLPRRHVKGRKRFWKHVDSALFTHLGRLRLPREVEPWVEQIVGHAPVLPPMGIAMNTAIGGDGGRLPGTFCVHASETALSMLEADELLRRMAFWMDRIASC